MKQQAINRTGIQSLSQGMARAVVRSHFKTDLSQQTLMFVTYLVFV